MKKKFLNICMVALLAAVCCFHTGCALQKYLLIGSEEEIFNQAVDDFFQALDARDKEAIRDMFASSVREKDEALDENIDKLLEYYSGPTDICKRNGRMVTGSYSNDHGVKSAEVYQGFPVVSNGTYYWCDFMLTYQNDEDENRIGIKEVLFYSAEYKCAESYGYIAESRKGMMDKGREDSEESALQVLTECSVDCEVRFVGGYPEKFHPVDRELSRGQVEEFFKTSYSYLEFVKEFGQPNVDMEFSGYSCAYELSDEGDEPRYLDLLIDPEEDTILSAYVKNDLDVVGICKLWDIKEMEKE